MTCTRGSTLNCPQTAREGGVRAAGCWRAGGTEEGMPCPFSVLHTSILTPAPLMLSRSSFSHRGTSFSLCGGDQNRFGRICPQATFDSCRWKGVEYSL